MKICMFTHKQSTTAPNSTEAGQLTMANQIGQPSHPIETFQPLKSQVKYIPHLTGGSGSSQASVEQEVALSGGESAARSSVKQSRKNHRLFQETVDVSRWTNRKREKRREHFYELYGFRSVARPRLSIPVGGFRTGGPDQ